MRDVQDHQFFHPLRKQMSRAPCNGSAQVVSDDRGPGGAARIHQRCNIAGKLIDVVCHQFGRLVAEVVSALIRSDDTIAFLCKEVNLFFPGLPEIRKTVKQNDRRPVLGTGFSHVQRNAVDPDHSVSKIHFGLNV